MNHITTYIRLSLKDIYPPEEVKALTMLICCDILGIDALDIYMGKDITLSECKQRELENIIFRLQKNEPIQYIRGFTEFHGRQFRVAPGVLVPRPETGELVDLIIKENPEAKSILDIGTGSGCISISLSKELPDAMVTAWDISEEALEIAKEIGFPVIVKAVLGGGGKGMRVAYTEEEFENAFLMAQKESGLAFGDESMYLEHFVENPRHIEFQILADNYGNVIHLGERDCSVQRNHQKVIEESPSAAVDEELRERMGKAAVLAAKAAGYKNAGTIEFLLEKDKSFYFMEMNTRIQVEHPVTEWVTGIDLIKAQIRIADGEKLKWKQEDIQITGHAIECRINAEDPSKNFRPCPGRITDMYLPGGKGVRIDSAIYSGCEVSPYYDSMITKLIVFAATRKEAIAKMHRALGEVIIEGITTNIDFLYEIMERPDYQEGDFTIQYLEKVLEEMGENK